MTVAASPSTDEAPRESLQTARYDSGFNAGLMHATVLVIDDESGMRNCLHKMLLGNVARVDVVQHTEDASRLLDSNTYDVIVLDNAMPDKSGLDWLAEQRQVGLLSDAIVITAFADLSIATQAIRAGASDLLLKPFRFNQLLKSIEQSIERTRLMRQSTSLRQEPGVGNGSLLNRGALLGNSKEIQHVRQSIERAATSSSHVVIRGEAGSGKQIAARMLHAASPRANSPFVWLQCYGMTEHLFRERLFGQLSNEANSSCTDHVGVLRSAEGGTLYLEDVELLSPNCQNILAELLSSGRFRPPGMSKSMELNVRVVSSTINSLSEYSKSRRFRTDLYYWLTVEEIILPPLRERPEDIIELTSYFLAILSQRMGIEVPQLTPAARRRFLSHTWPENVLELQNTIERALLHGNFDSALTDKTLPSTLDSLAAVEQRHVLSVLETCNGNRSEAARRLGIARRTIDRKCQSWGL